jgi:RND family efflux transporter MFP subunit
MAHFDARVKYWLLGGFLAVALVVGGGYGLMRNSSAAPSGESTHDEHGDDEVVEIPTVYVASPQAGGMDRTTTQPGTVVADKSVPLFAAVSGYLKTLNVDIGDRVKEGQVLAVIAVPELEKQLKLDKAAVKRADKKVDQVRALKEVYRADLLAAKASVKQTEAAAKSAEAWRDFRKKESDRLKRLGSDSTIDAGVVDESFRRYLASEESLNSAIEAIAASKAKEAAVQAKIDRSDADIDEALEAVEVARAQAEKSQEIVNYATIKAGFDGVITQRSVNTPDFIRAATLSANQPPLLTLDKVDKVRVVVMVPDRDIIFTDVGDETRVEIDALPGKVFKAPIARISKSEEPKSRTMRVEIDLDNPDGKLCQGMYGHVTITLEKSANVLALPSSCVINRNENKGQVYVVRNKHAALTTVAIVGESGYNVGISGLSPRDQVITNPSAVSGNGAEVNVVQPKKKSSGR